MIWAILLVVALMGGLLALLWRCSRIRPGPRVYQFPLVAISDSEDDSDIDLPY